MREERLDTETLFLPRPVSPLPYPVPYSDEWCKLYGLTMEDTYSLDQWEIAVEDTYSEEEEEDPEGDLEEAVRFSQTDSLYGEFQIEEDPVPEEDTVSDEEEDPEEDLEEWERLSETDSTESDAIDYMTIAQALDGEADLEESEGFSETGYESDGVESYEVSVFANPNNADVESDEQSVEEARFFANPKYADVESDELSVEEARLFANPKYADMESEEQSVEEARFFANPNNTLVSIDHNGFGPHAQHGTIILESHLLANDSADTNGKRKRKTTDDGIQDDRTKISEVRWVRNNRRRLSRIEQ